MSDVTEMSRDSLEHEVLQQQMKTISAQITANFDVVGEQLEGILSQAKKTNGRVTRLEHITSVLDIMQRNKWLTGLVIYALYTLLDSASPENIMKLIKMLL